MVVEFIDETSKTEFEICKQKTFSPVSLNSSQTDKA